MSQFVRISFLLLSFVTLISFTSQDQIKNKYTKEANINYKEVKQPFRIGKLNLVWNKAQHKLSVTKLKSLYTDLMAQDKDEIKLKRLKSDGMDKDGLQEAFIRKKLKDLLTMYDLLGHFEPDTVPEKLSKTDKEREHNHINKRIFKDKKLGKLWEKAEKAGFDQKELKLLKQEFQHHQDKIDEYYSVLEKTEGENDVRKNYLHLDELEHMDNEEKSRLPSKKYPDGGLPNVNDIRTKHRDIKDGYDVLHQRISTGKDSREFAELRVANLWNMALKSDFNSEELDSLREELKHYEKRVIKLQHLQSEYLLKKMNPDDDGGKDYHHQDKEDDSYFADKIKRHERIVEKLHLDLENMIRTRHSEL